VICLCSDGDMQEGVASEACALAGHWGLDNLIFIYDSNAVTLDAPAKETQSEDTGKRMEAYGFDVQEIDGHDMQQFLDAFDVAKRRDNGKPQFIIAHTLIGKGVPEVEGTFKAHGEAGAKYVDAARKALGLPAEHYFVSQEVYDYFAEHKKKLLADYEKWEETYNSWRTKNPDKAKMLAHGLDRKVPADLLSKIPEFPKDAKLATRKAGGEVLQPIAQAIPLLMSGSADLDATSGSVFANTGCARSLTVSHITGCSARQARRSQCLPIIAVLPFGWLRWRSFPIPIFSRTIQSALVKMVRLINRWKQ